MKKLLIFSVFAIAIGSVYAKDLRTAARTEYQACLKETARARKECSFGGCGNILGACYEREIAIFENDSNRISEKLDRGSCTASSVRVNEEFSNLEQRLLKIAQFDNTWSGFDLRVELAAVKNRSLVLLQSECTPVKTDR
jgi:hypothetical protein